MLASIWWIKWPQLAGFQGRTCWENTGAARNASFTMAISMCLGRVLVSLWASGLLGHPSSFFRDAFSCNTAAPLFLPHKNSAKNMCMLTFTQQLGTWSWNTTWEIQVFFRVPCETLQEILEYASGGRQGSPRGISQGLTLTHGLLLLRVGCNLKVGHFDTKKHTPQVVNPRISRYFCKIVGMIFFWQKFKGVASQVTSPQCEDPKKFLLCLRSWPGFLMQSWMLSVIQSRRQPTFCTLVWGMAWLVDAGYILYILMVWLMAMAMVVGTISSIPQVCSHKITKPLWGCSCLAPSSTCTKGSHFFPGKTGRGWRDECRDDWPERGHFFQKGISSASQIFILRMLMLLIFFLWLIRRVRNF